MFIFVNILVGVNPVISYKGKISHLWSLWLRSMFLLIIDSSIDVIDVHKCSFDVAIKIILEVNGAWYFGICLYADDKMSQGVLGKS